MGVVHADISPDKRAIVVKFEYDVVLKNRIKKIPGCRFRKYAEDKKLIEPHWRMHLDIQTARYLRTAAGKSLRLSPALRRWGKEQIQNEKNLKSLANAKSAKLKRLPKRLPIMWDLINGRPIEGFPAEHALSGERDPRPYQTADIRLMAESNILNSNGMGTGKTVEAIGSVFEAGLDDMPHLVVAPITSHLDPWLEELERYQDIDIIYGEGPRERRDAIEQAFEMYQESEPFWLIIGFDDLRMKRGRPSEVIDLKKHKWGFDHHRKVTVPLKPANIRLMEIEWGSVTIDEVHKSGLSNPRTMFARAAAYLEADKRQVMSGTPMGGKPIRLWGLLHWLDSAAFSSMWRWAETWLEIEDNDYGGKEIGDIKKGKLDEFVEAHSHYLVRRTKKEALPGMPPKQYIDVWVKMTKTQKEQYLQFEAEAELRIEEEHLTATSILAEYTRLKQLSNAKCTISKRIVRPRGLNVEVILKGLQATKDCPKLAPLLERLDEHGIRRHDPEPGARAIVASQSKDMIKMVANWLYKQKLNVDILTGDTKQGKDRDRVISWYKEKTDDARILCMTTQTGGVSLNLEMTGSVHILDETWNPDDQEQLEDRGDRGTRTTPLICYYYRTHDSIQEQIYDRSLSKRITNRNILDFRSKRLEGNDDLVRRIRALRARSRKRVRDSGLSSSRRSRQRIRTRAGGTETVASARAGDPRTRKD